MRVVGQQFDPNLYEAVLENPVKIMKKILLLKNSERISFGWQSFKTCARESLDVLKTNFTRR